MPPRCRRTRTSYNFSVRSAAPNVAMCDAPAPGFVATVRDTVTCSWMFYSNSSQSNSTSRGNPPGEFGSATGGGPSAPPAAPVSDPDLDSMHMMLDPHLRPLTPDMDNETSKQIFEDNKQLAREYLKVQTELAYLSRTKTELENQMDDEVLQQKREVIELKNEEDSLVKLYWSLKDQLDLMERQSWMLIPEELPQ